MRRLILPCLALLAGVLMLFAGGCGFQLKAPPALPFHTMKIDLPENSDVGIYLRRAIRTSSTTQLVDKAEDAEAIFVQTSYLQQREVLSYSGGGKIQEYQLRILIAYRITDPKGRDLTPPVNLTLHRDMTYGDSEILSKEQEETMLWKDMQQDAAQQIMRRLAAIKPLNPDDEDE